MPKAVSTYKETGSFIEVSKIHDDLIQSYTDDIRKYAKGEKQLLNCGETFTRLFNQVGKQLKYTKLMVGEDVKRTKKSLQLLEQAMVVHIVKNVIPSGLPLGASANEKQFKIIFLDIGLGQRASGLNLSSYNSSDNLLSLYEGRLAEQFVGQQLLAESEGASENGKLYFWMRSEKSASAEVDYLIVRNGKIIPVEVKRGKSGSLKSLHLFLKTFGGIGICLQDRDLCSHMQNLTFAPIYSIL
jgi:predicted AAA+ superfamily ATPase